MTDAGNIQGGLHVPTPLGSRRKKLKKRGSQYAAGALIRASDTGRVLFLQRSDEGDHGGEWAFPGGGIEPGVDDSALEAAVRECEEEIGYALNSNSMKLLDHRVMNGVDFTTYGAKVPKEFAPSLNDEHGAYRWQDIDEPPSPLHPGVAATIGQARTLYVNRPVLNADELIAWAKQYAGCETCVTSDDMHVTVAFSKEPLAWPKPMGGELSIYVKNAHVKMFGPEGDCVVLAFDSDDLQERWQYFIDTGASWSWPDYSPHITLSYHGFNSNGIAPAQIPPFSGRIVLGPEEFSEVTEGWGDKVVQKGIDMNDEFFEQDRIQKIGRRNNSKDQKMIQQMHDHACALGADCNGLVGYDTNLISNDDAVNKVARIAKVDESLGLVFGYAIVCTKNGKPYYDLNIDKGEDGTYKRVPEHIPEDAMLKAAVDFMGTDRVGNEMHAGPDTGTYVFAFPLTADIAKAFGIQTNTTGLMIAYKPPPEVFAKFKSGEYTGFSIEGRRVSAVETE